MKMYGGKTHSEMQEIENSYDAQEILLAARRKKVRIITVALLVLVVVLITAICLEVHHPVAAPPPVVKNISTKVHSMRLPDHVLSHREGFRSNSHLQLVHEVQKHLNVSNCWLCSRLPQSVTGGLRSFSEPVPANTTLVALFFSLLLTKRDLGLLFYRGLVRETEHAPAVRDAYLRYSDLDGGVVDWLLGETDNIIWVGPTKRPRIAPELVPYRRLIDPGSSDERRLLEDCVHSADHVSDLCPTPMHTHLVRPPPLCFRKEGERDMGNTTNCEKIIELSSSPDYAVPLYMGPSLYLICGSNVYIWLPRTWSGVCFVSLLLPDVVPVKSEDLHRLALPTVSPALLSRHKRSSAWSYSFKDFVKGLVPMYGITENSHAIHELATLLARSANVSATAFAAMSAELRALKLISTQNRLGIDLVFAKQGGLCKVIGVTCCLFVPSSSKTVSDSIQQLHEIGHGAQDVAKSMEEWPAVSWLTDKWYSWGWKILIAIVVVLAAVMVLCLCVQCLPVLCAKAADAAIPSRQMPSRLVGAVPSSTSTASAPVILAPPFKSYGHVPGYGTLPAVLQYPPRLGLRHLYDVQLASPSPPEYCEQDPVSGSGTASGGSVPKDAPPIYRLRAEFCT